MLQRRIKLGLFSILALFFLVTILSLTLSNDARLEEFLAKALIQENVAGVDNHLTALSQSVIVRVSNVNVYEGPITALKAWRYTRDGLTTENPEIFLIATSGDRSHWPPYTFEFAVKYITPLVATVQIVTLYDQGILPTSRGGHADTWTLVNLLGNWLIVSKRSGEYWD